VLPVIIIEGGSSCQDQRPESWTVVQCW
jgi:hypothetical protein